MKIRIGISAGGQGLGPGAMAGLGGGILDPGLAPLWFPGSWSRPGPARLVGLAGPSGACPGLKIGTTMLLPGRNLVWLAKAIATLDQLSGGRFLLTFVPGLSIGGERRAVCPHGRGAAGAAPALGRGGGQLRRAGRLVRRCLGLAPPGPGPVRRLA